MTVYTDASVTRSALALFFMKKTLHNPDGSNDLVTVITLAHQGVPKMLILSILKKIMDKYFEFRKEMPASAAATTYSENSPTSPNSPLSPQAPAKSKLGGFKLYMNQIILQEELRYDRNSHAYLYGSVAQSDVNNSEVLTPNQLVAANDEVEEVRNIMLDNVNKLMTRGDKINNLVDQTDRLTSSLGLFQKSAVSIKRKIWLNNAKFVLITILAILIFAYLLIGLECGYPFYLRCFHH